ncbi:RTX toxin [Salinibacterium sp. UTAS2018]|uniref:RTX toxin n=1 Tax=Salinibacterium sp. UTAS2018 TaxID=2508880 RepID=UPI001FF02DA1|nr:RTX toxin [Salinibacterium sp. UTAS2018]
MNNFLARLRAANRSPRFDQSTGQKRKRFSLRDTRGIAAIVALALVVGSGLAVVSVSSAAEAHTPKISVDCEGVTVSAEYYGTGGANLVTIQIDGGETKTFEFGKRFDFSAHADSFKFDDSTKKHTYTATITAYNATTASQKASWNLTKSGESVPCTSQSIIDLSASSCDVVGGTTDLSAKFADLVAGRSYDVTLKSSTGDSVTKSFTAKQTVQSYTWPTAVTAGLTYTMTIVDTKNPGLTASKIVHSVACPEVGGIAITANECTVPGEFAGLKVELSDLVIGREYKVEVFNAADSSTSVGGTTFTANAVIGTYNYADATPSGSYFATILDVKKGGEPLTSSTRTLLPCPDEIAQPVLTATQCDVVSSEAEGEMAVAIDGLVPGRAYDIVVTNASGASVLTKSAFVATASSVNETLTGLADGVYTATVTDVLVPSFTNTASVTLLPCATNETTVVLSAEQCTVPGGDASISATVENYAVGRDYTVALMLNNVVVGEPRALDSSTGAAQEFTFDGLETENAYRVVVTDTASNPTVTAAADMYLDACPETPAVLGSQVECSVDGESTLEISAGNLFAGETYTVTVVTKSTGEPVDGVEPVVFVADMPTRTVMIENVPNGDTYTVTVESMNMELVSVNEFTLEVCDLPTLPLAPEEPATTIPSTVDLPTLAYTGSSTIAPTLAGLGFLQLGLVLVGFSVARRRSVVRGS